MSTLFIKSYIHTKSLDQLYDYKSEINTYQSFTINNSTSFFRNNYLIKAKQKNQNEKFDNRDLIYDIEKITKNNKQIYLFVPKNNISYHNYRLDTKNKKRDIPTFISLYNFNFDKKEFDIKEKRKKKDIIKHNKNYYELNVGDVIKLGRISLILTKIHLEQNNSLSYCDTFVETNLNKKESKYIKYNRVEKNIFQNYNINKSKFKMKKSYEKMITNTKGDLEEFQEENKSNSEKKDICRICFMDVNDSNSPLLSLCKCSGDSKFIHLDCLSRWLKIKSEIVDYPNNIFKKITFNTLDCEICKEKFPEMVYDITNEKSYQIYNPEKFITSLNNIYHNYVIFESFELINHKKIIYVVSFDIKNKITIGRSQSSDMKIIDVTISRIHSILLRTKENKILIKDANSKFGTLILLQSKNILINNKILSIQIGKILLNLYNEYYKLNYIINLFNCIFCCFCCNKKKKGKNSNENKNISCCNNKNKKITLDDSNFNMLMINNYITTGDGNNLDYNNINKNNINIEEIIDIRYLVDNNVVKSEE